MPMEIPWWYQPTGSGETGSIDRRVEGGYPIAPPQIEIRDGGIFWSHDPDHQIPRINPLADGTPQLFGRLQAIFALLYGRSSKKNTISEMDGITLMEQVKHIRSCLASISTLPR
jgi:hypothetical protein